MPRPSKSPPPTTGVSTPEPPTGVRSTWLCLLLFATVLAAYLPALSGGFLWDDAGHVTRADLRGLAGLGRIWFEFGATQQYYPVLHSAFWFEHLLWGDSTLAYHLINVLLHGTGACLFGLLLRRLAVPGAWWAAFLFALHPVCVESVAWISEQKNTLSTVLYLAAALAYLRFDTHRRPAHYALATALFLLALLTKTVTATLPAALLVVFWWRRGRLDRKGADESRVSSDQSQARSAGPPARVVRSSIGPSSLDSGLSTGWLRLDWRRAVLPLLPWFGLGACAGLVTAYFERELIGASGADFALTLLQRLLLAGRIVWFYLGKLAWPAELIFIYPRWTIDAAQPWQWLFPLAALGLLAGLTALAWKRSQRGPLAALLLFAGTLFPVLGFFNVFPFLFSYVADHFQYLASLGIFALAGAGLALGVARLPRAGALVAAAMLGTLGTLTWAQCGTYRDLFTLYETTLARNPACWMAHQNLAIALADAGRIEEAIIHLQAALRLKPDHAPAENNLGDCRLRLGRPAEALPHFARAVQLKPNYAVAHCNLGQTLARLGRFEEGVRHFAEAARLDPRYPQAELNWGVALMEADRLAEALPHSARAVQLAPRWAEARLAHGRILAGSDRMDEAAAQFRAAVELEPASGEAHLLLSYALRALSRTEEAQTHFREAKRLGTATP